MRIWKWTLALVDTQVINMPDGATFLDVQMQGEMPQLWALCDEGAPKESRCIAIYGTGNHIPDNPGKYVSTFQLQNGGLVFHAFELLSDEGEDKQ